MTQLLESGMHILEVILILQHTDGNLDQIMTIVIRLV
jgi:hypothetical protein